MKYDDSIPNVYVRLSAATSDCHAFLVPFATIKPEELSNDKSGLSLALTTHGMRGALESLKLPEDVNDPVRVRADALALLDSHDVNKTLEDICRGFS